MNSVEIPSLKEAFSWRRLAGIALVGFLTRVLTGVCFYLLLSVPQGWSGIATILVMYAVAFAMPVRVNQHETSLIGIAFGSNAPGVDGAWPRATRVTVAIALAVGAVPAATALVTMPGSGRAVDTVTGILVGAVLLVLQLWAIALRATRKRGRGRRQG